MVPPEPDTGGAISLHYLVIAMLFVALLVIGPNTDAENYGRWPVGMTAVCVESHLTHRWGLPNALRIWNAVDAGQPKFVRQASCPDTGTVTVSDINDPVWKAGGVSNITLDDNGLITHVDIVMNDAGVNNSKWDRRWKRYASGHEFGHSLGLGHSFGHPRSIMCYCTNSIKNNGTLSRYDRLSLHSLY